ncbi:FHA domain-containing protein [Agromyces sp. SYSU T0242]|uniref:FHA domain-containing protein n=1 Tax=Agromyces litoreus TaxID=3158561 RepID=UPI003397959D
MDGRPAESVRRLIVVAGGDLGTVIDVPRSTSLVGREGDADIRLPYDGVSRRHVVLDASGPVVIAVDQQSRNGTWVNGRRVDRPVQLHDGDVLTVGPVQLRLVEVGSGTPSATGPSPTASGAGDAYTSQRDQFIAAGNQTWNQTIHVQGEDASDEIFEGRGPGRVIAIIGSIVALGGFAWAGFTFFALATYSGPGIPEFPVEFGYAFGLFLLGGVLAGIGSGMSRAQRRREGR